MNDELYDAIADLIENLFIFPVNQRKAVWVWVDSDLQCDHDYYRAPLLTYGIGAVQRLRELYEIERISREDETQEGDASS